MPWAQLPKRIHYALKCLAYLARAESPVRARELAQRTGLPPAQAAKILYLLTWGGFVRSRRGSQGGFWLRVPPKQIRLREVMAFFHPPLDGEPKDSNDTVLQAWQEAASPLRQSFAQLTLADLVGDSRPAQAFRNLLNEEDDWPFCP